MLKRFKKNLVGLLAVSTLGLGGLLMNGCEEYDEPKSTKPAKEIPIDRDANLSFLDTKTGIGNLNLGDRDPYWLTNQNFSVYNGHKGGTGDTLQLVNYGEGIYVSSSYSTLDEISVFGNWRGVVEPSGIMLGDSAQTFWGVYPQSIRRGNTISTTINRKIGDTVYESLNYTLRADLEDDKIRRLRLDQLSSEDDYYFGP